MNRIIEQLRRHAETQPSVAAVVSNGSVFDYARLWQAATSTAKILETAHVRSVGIYLDNGIEWVISDLAAMIAGIRVIPLPWFFSDRQIAHAVNDAGVDHVIAATGLPAGIAGTGNHLELFANSRLYPLTRESQADCQPGSAKISFTSGSTGAPKGIHLSTGLIEATSMSLCETLAEKDIQRHLGMLPYATLLENIAGIYVPLLLGRTIHAEPASAIGLTSDLKLNAQTLAATFNRVRPNSLILTPQLLETLLTLAESCLIDPSCLKFVAVGGAHVSATLLDRSQAIGLPAYQGYGLTEFASVATLNTPRENRSGSVGKPLPGVNLCLGEQNEILLTRKVVSYQNGKRKTESIQVATGDYGAVDADGFVYVQGRRSNLIVLSTGRNVSPEWIESELNSARNILQSFVYSRNGEDLSALVFSAGDDKDIHNDIQRINTRLPAYAQVSYWQRLEQPFSVDNRMLTANGRLRRQQIQQSLSLLPSGGKAPRKQPEVKPFIPSFKEPLTC